MREPTMWHQFWRGFVIVAIAIGFILAIILGFMVGLPGYNVYRARQAGNAELQQAEYNRQILVVQAKAEQDAAESKKQAAIIRAQGIAEANRIIGQSLSPEYVQWLWVDGLNEGLNKNQIIYVPASGLMPTFQFSQPVTSR